MVKGYSRAGGAIQQARAFADLVKEDPSRFIHILPHLKPQEHENYAGRALEVLAESSFPTKDLFLIIEGLDQRGFVSEAFRSDAAHALEKIAEQNEGLPQSFLRLLEGWLPTHSHPELAFYRSKEDQAHDLEHLFSSAEAVSMHSQVEKEVLCERSLKGISSKTCQP